MIRRAMVLLSEHKASVEWTRPLTLARDPKYLPCVNVESGCRTTTPPLPFAGAVNTELDEER